MRSSRIALACAMMAVVLCGLGSMAQAKAPQCFGFKLGGVAAKQEWFGDRWLDTRWGLIAGGFINVLELPHCTFLVECDYVQKGAKLNWVETDFEGHESRPSPRVDYISIPLLAKIHGGVGRLAPYLLVGPTVDIPVHTDWDGSFDLSYAVGDFKRVDFGAAFGLGLEAPARHVTPLAEFRYCPSFNNAIDHDGLTIRNRCMELLLGVRL